MKKTQSVSSAIENLAQKRHVISEEALKAKASLQSDHTLSSALQKKMGTLEEFNHSVKLLISVFKQSHFDEMAIFINQPARVMTINLFIGVVRGIGFAIGMILILGFVATLSANTLPPELVKDIPIVNLFI